MAYDQYGEKIGIGDSLVSNLITVQFDVKSTCRCCGATISTADHKFLFETYLPFENIQRWLKSEDIDKSAMRLVQQGANTSSSKHNPSKGEGA